MIIGTLGAAAALASGYLFTTAQTDGEVAKIYNWHKTAALATLIIMTITTIVRIFLTIKQKEESPLKWVSFGLYFLGATCVGITGFMGGTMVYKYLLGI